MNRPADHYCATCRYALNRRTTGDVDTFEHARSFEQTGAQPHPPVPVPLIEFIKPNMICDFCSAPGPSLSYTFTEMDLLFVNDDTGDRFMENYGQEWTACTGCSTWIDQHNVNGLIARVVRKYPAAQRSAISDHLRPLYGALLLNPFTKRAMESK